MSSQDHESEGAPVPEEATVSVRPVVDAPSSLVGRVIATKYVVREILGRGGMGVVVRAHHLALDQPVALKFLLGSTPTASARFQREARIVFQLTGEHIVRLFDVGTLDDGAPYLVMELVHGETLAQRIARDGPLPIPVAIDFVLQACVGLAEAHRAAIVHRDLKPSNLMLTSRADGTPLVKVLDFGIAKIVGPGSSAQDGDGAPPSIGAIARLEVADTVSSDPAPAGPKTRGTAIVGSPLYMSPEQIERPADVDARTDVWALGVLLHELVSGKTPFESDSVADVAAAITERPPTLAFAGDDEARALEDVVLRCLARAPQGRFQDVGELAAALALVGDPSTASALAEKAARVLARSPSSLSDASTRSAGAVRALGDDASAARRTPRYAAWAAAVAAVPAVVVLVAWLVTSSRVPQAATSLPTSEAAGDATNAVAPSMGARSASAPAAVAGACAPEMIFVPAGRFTMGVPKGSGFDRSSPERDVELSAYCIDRNEVTVEAYQKCIDAPRGELRCTPAKTPAQFRADDPPKKPVTIDQCNTGVEGRGAHPINCVDWNQATTYCKWVTNGRGQLPTEAQWERAARGTDKRTYPWGEGKSSIELVNGNDESYRAWRKSAGLDEVKSPYPGNDGWPFTAPVGSFPKGASPVGALDMAGNVGEWIADYYDEYDETALRDPFRSSRPPNKKDAHVTRGGAWPDNVNKTTWRSAWMTHQSYPDLGFRCAAPPE